MNGVEAPTHKNNGSKRDFFYSSAIEEFFLSKESFPAIKPFCTIDVKYLRGTTSQQRQYNALHTWYTIYKY